MTLGHAAVRTTPIDDIALGRRIKAQGLRWRIVDANEYISCRMYRGFANARDGFSKNLFAVFDFRVLEYVFVWLWITLVTLEPLGIAGLWLLNIARATFDLRLAVLAIGEMLALWGITLARLHFPLGLMWLYPLHILILVFIAFRSMFWTMFGRTRWKGRSLPRQRVRLV